MNITIEAGGADWPAVVQAVGSILAILVAASIPVYERWLDRQRRNAQRLSLTTTRDSDTHLSLIISYKAEQTNVALYAQVTLLEPVTGILLSGERALRRQQGYALPMASVEVIVEAAARTKRTELKHLEGDSDNVFEGGVFVLGRTDNPLPTHGVVEIEIHADVTHERLAKRRMPFSPVN